MLKLYSIYVTMIENETDDIIPLTIIIPAVDEEHARRAAFAIGMEVNIATEFQTKMVKNFDSLINPTEFGAK